MVSPGIEADRYSEGDRWNILISLRETKSRGDVENFFIERTVKRGFMQDVEEPQVEIRHVTRKLKIAIIFPAKRPCRRAVFLKRSRYRSEQLDEDCYHTLPDGRRQLVWQTKNVRHFEVFTIKWWW